MLVIVTSIESPSLDFQLDKATALIKSNSCVCIICKAFLSIGLSVIVSKFPKVLSKKVFNVASCIPFNGIFASR